MRDDLRPARLLWEVRTEGFGGQVQVCDVNGDGKLELLIRQSMGQLRSEAHFVRFGPMGWYRDGERKLFCLTAIDLQGNTLWQVGEPHTGEMPYCSHGANDFEVADLDGDGLPEVLSVVWDTLTVFDGVTGAIKAEKKLPADNFAQVKTGALKGDPTRKQMLVKVNAAPYPPYDYGNPTYVLDGDLSEMWMTPYYHGAGHAPVFLDLDGDGCDEILIGYNLVDHDGSLQWTVPVENASKEHVDNINPSDLDGDGIVEIAYSGSKDFFVANPEGEVLWKREHAHSQTSISGRFRQDVDGLTLILNEKWIGMTCYTPTGERLWSREGVGYAGNRLHGWRDDGLDLILYRPALKKAKGEAPFESVPEDSRLYWPHVMDGEGNRTVEFPYFEAYDQPSQHIRGERGYDYGIGFSSQVLDLDGDGKDEVVIHDRRRVLAFGAPEG